MSIVSLLREAAERLADDAALVDDAGRSLTYGEWLPRSRKVAAGVASERTGAPLILAFRNAEVLDFAAAFMGVVGSGRVAVPLRLPTPAAEIERIAEEVGASCVLSTTEVHTGLRHLSVPAMLEARGGIDLIEDFAPGDPAQILSSSGTTGVPKAIVVPHGNLTWSAHPRPEQSPERKHIVQAFPIGTSAFQNQFLRTLTSDYMVRVLSMFNPKKLLRILRTEDVFGILVTPAMVPLLDHVVPEGEELASVDGVGLTGSFPQPDHFRMLSRIFPSATIITSYGSTESSPAGTSRTFDPENPLNVGPPNPGCAIKITTEDREPLRAGETGVVWLSARGAPRRWYLDDRLNTEYFDGEWVRTGDLGHLEEDGSLVVVGRATDVISVGGLKVSGPEVEAVLSRHPAVHDVAVYGYPHEILGQEVAADVVTRHEADEQDILAFAGAQLARHKVPSRIVFVDRLERNEMGKIARRPAP